MDDLLHALNARKDDARENVKMRLIASMPENPTRDEAVEALLNDVEQTLLPAMARLMTDMVGIGGITVMNVADADEYAVGMMTLAAFLIETRLGGEVRFSTNEYNAWVESHPAPFHVHDYGPDDAAVLRVHSTDDDAPNGRVN